jgi:hypothetical protein
MIRHSLERAVAFPDEPDAVDSLLTESADGPARAQDRARIIFDCLMAGSPERKSGGKLQATRRSLVQGTTQKRLGFPMKCGAGI